MNNDEFKNSGKVWMILAGALLLAIIAYAIANGGLGEKRIQTSGKVVETVKDFELDGEGNETIVNEVSKDTIQTIISEFETTDNNRLEAIKMLEEKQQEVYDASFTRFKLEQEKNSNNNGIRYYIDARQWAYHIGFLDLRPVLKVEGVKDYTNIISKTRRARLNDAQIAEFSGTKYESFLKKYSMSNPVPNGPYDVLKQISISTQSISMSSGSYDRYMGAIKASKMYTYEEMLNVKRIAEEYGMSAFEQYTCSQLEDLYEQAKADKEAYFDTFLELDEVYRTYINQYVNKYVEEYQKYIDTIGDYCYRFMQLQSNEELEKLIEEYKESSVYKANREQLMLKYGKQGEYTNVINTKAYPYSEVYNWDYPDNVKMYGEYKKLVCGIPNLDIQISDNYLDEPKYINRLEENIEKQLKEQNKRLYDFKLFIINNNIDMEFDFLDSQIYYERCLLGDRTVGKITEEDIQAGIEKEENEIQSQINKEAMVDDKGGSLIEGEEGTEVDKGEKEEGSNGGVGDVQNNDTNNDVSSTDSKNEGSKSSAGEQ